MCGCDRCSRLLERRGQSVPQVGHSRLDRAPQAGLAGFGLRGKACAGGTGAAGFWNGEVSLFHKLVTPVLTVLHRPGLAGFGLRGKACVGVTGAAGFWNGEVSLFHKLVTPVLNVLHRPGLAGWGGADFGLRGKWCVPEVGAPGREVEGCAYSFCFHFAMSKKGLEVLVRRPLRSSSMRAILASIAAFRGCLAAASCFHFASSVFCFLARIFIR